MEHKHVPTWERLDAMGSDVSLLTEAVVPPDRIGVWRSQTDGRDGGVRRWSAAVVTEHPCVEITDARASWRGHKRDVPFVSSRPGAWAAAKVEVPGLGPVTAVALYGLMDEFSDASMHRSLSELSPLVDDKRYSNLLVIGGDFNTGTQWPAHDPFLARDRNVLDRLLAWGMVDCVAAKRPPGELEGCTCGLGRDCAHVRTRRDGRYPAVPYQTDYLFASPALAERLQSCEVLADDEWFAVSDHAPITANFR
jgi:endonuclease/exonuclease/phosphatase family metal-dependent hydrolase